MRTKYVYLKRVLLFVLIFLVLMGAMAWAFSCHPDHRIYQSIGCFYDEPEDSMQAIYIGSSNCYAFWNPLVAWNNHGLAVYSDSVGSLPFYATEYLIKDLRQTQPDALFIVNINSVEQNDLNSAAIHAVLNYMPDSENKEALMNYLADLIGYSQMDRLQFTHPWMKLREFWPYFVINGIKPEPDGLKGSANYDSYFETYCDVTDAYVHSQHRTELLPEMTACVEHLLDYCDAEDINILFVSVPRAEISEETLGRINSVADMIEDRGYPMLRLTDLNERIGLDLTQDFYNNRHTNVHGSIKYTNYLSDYLVERYGFEDLRGAAGYESWEAGWEGYAEVLGAHILDFELDAAHRNYALAAPETLHARAGEAGATIEWTKVPGADGYAVFRKEGPEGAWQAQSTLGDVDRYLDADVKAGGTYVYTVVPITISGGETFYGNFSYEGAGVELPSSK